MAEADLLNRPQAYVPHHGDANYSDVEFFKKVRARYYVFSGVEPSKEVLNALLEAKMTWENKDLGKAAFFVAKLSYLNHHICT
jgi:beta-lactamase superfamily II metal-dependent hydrolase